MLIREITAPVSLASKKKRACDLVKKIKHKQKKLEESLDEVVVETDFEDEGSPSPI